MMQMNIHGMAGLLLVLAVLSLYYFVSHYSCFHAHHHHHHALKHHNGDSDDDYVDDDANETRSLLPLIKHHSFLTMTTPMMNVDENTQLIRSIALTEISSSSS